MLKISASEAVTGEVFLQEKSLVAFDSMSADVSSAVLSSCHQMTEMCQGVCRGSVSCVAV